MDFLGWAQVRSFNCDMYWPLLNMYWESSGFGLGVFCIGGGGCYYLGGRDSICRHTDVCVCVYVDICMYICLCAFNGVISFGSRGFLQIASISMRLLIRPFPAPVAHEPCSKLLQREL